MAYQGVNAGYGLNVNEIICWFTGNSWNEGIPQAGYGVFCDELMPLNVLTTATGEPLTTTCGDFLTHDSGDYPMIYQDYMPSYSSRRTKPITIDPDDGAVIVLSFDENMIAGTYSISVYFVGEYVDSGDDTLWSIRGGISSPKFFHEAQHDSEVEGFLWETELDWKGDQLAFSLNASVTFASSVTIPEAIIKVKRTA
jgi:hypothetical protein